MPSIFVGNLSFEASEDDVRSLFNAFGEVKSVKIINDRETGRPRGFCFVEMSDPGCSKEAIYGLNGHEFMGRALAVNEARPAERKPQGGYQRGGGNREPYRGGR